MSWIVNPTIYRGPVTRTFAPYPTYFSPTALVTPVLSGRDTHAGLIAYLPNETLTALNVYTISATLSYCLLYSGNTLKRQAGLVNELPWYRSEYYQIYYTPSYGWVLIPVATFPGYAPTEWQDKDDVWQGDSFYTAATIPGIASTADVTFTGRGPHKNTSPVPTVAVAFTWPRWCKTTGTTVPYGVYTAVVDSGATGTKIVGNPYWTSGGVSRMRSAEKVSGHYEYGGTTYDPITDRYVIGNIGDVAGWWVGDEPAVGSNRTFNFAKPDGSEITGTNIVYTWGGYLPGSETETVYMGEIGVYR